MICGKCNRRLVYREGETTCRDCQLHDRVMDLWADERIAARAAKANAPAPAPGAPRAGLSVPAKPKPAKRPRREMSEPCGQDPAAFAKRIARWLKSAGGSAPYGKLRRDMHGWRYPFREALDMLASAGDVRVDRKPGRVRGARVALTRWPPSVIGGDWLSWQKAERDAEAVRRRRRRQHEYRKGRHSRWFSERTGYPES